MTKLESKIGPLSGLVAALLFIAAIAWHNEDRVYDVDDYHDDVNWCIAHDWEFTSDSIGQPVTCLKDGQPVAIPPNSIKAPPKEQP